MQYKDIYLLAGRDRHKTRSERKISPQLRHFIRGNTKTGVSTSTGLSNVLLSEVQAQ